MNATAVMDRNIRVGEKRHRAGLRSGSAPDTVCSMTEEDRPDPGSGIGVLVVDDHDLFRTGLVTMLQAEPGIEVLAQASLGRMGVRLARELRPDGVLMALRMPVLDGGGWR